MSLWFKREGGRERNLDSQEGGREREGGRGREREGRAFTVAAVTVAAAACSVQQPPAPRLRRAVTGLGLNATPYRPRGSASQTRRTAGAVFQVREWKAHETTGVVQSELAYRRGHARPAPQHDSGHPTNLGFSLHLNTVSTMMDEFDG